jgi:hypothetical protein
VKSRKLKVEDRSVLLRDSLKSRRAVGWVEQGRAEEKLKVESEKLKVEDGFVLLRDGLKR